MPYQAGRLELRNGARPLRGALAQAGTPAPLR